MALLDNLKWRYATKAYDSTKKVDQEDVDKIIEAARLAPTSSGLEQFRIIVINDQKLKEKIVPIAMDQKNIAQCSHLLVFAAWDKYTEERIDDLNKDLVNDPNLLEAIKKEEYLLYYFKKYRNQIKVS